MRFPSKRLSDSTDLGEGGGGTGAKGFREGTNAVSSNGVAANSSFFDRDFFGTRIDLLLSSQKCQGVFFSNPSKFITLAATPLVLTPFVHKRKVKPLRASQSLSETFPCAGYQAFSPKGTTLGGSHAHWNLSALSAPPSILLLLLLLIIMIIIPARRDGCGHRGVAGAPLGQWRTAWHPLQHMCIHFLQTSLDHVKRRRPREALHLSLHPKGTRRAHQSHRTVLKSTHLPSVWHVTTSRSLSCLTSRKRHGS